jgi:hypothetical protein
VNGAKPEPASTTARDLDERRNAEVETTSSTAATRPPTHSAPATTPHEPAAGAPSPIAVRPGRTWTITTTSGLTVSGYLPGWAEEDPSQSGVALERLGLELADITHEAPCPGQMLPVVSGSGPAEEAEVFWGTIVCHPFTEDPEPRLPVVNVRIIDDYWTTDLGPAELADLAKKLRAQANRLDNEVRPALIAARDDWATHHTT